VFERFGKDAKRVAARAIDEAMAGGSPTVEAEHLLLALTREQDGPAARALGRHGLDRDDVLAALEAEQRQSLAAVGVELDDFDLARPAAAKAPGWAASSKLALQRAVKAGAAHGPRRIGTAHLLVGVLQAEAGTVPRALALVAVGREALAATARAELAAG
jgi:ATP-dependent Clp protease ATP-binding subunit ClpA